MATGVYDVFKTGMMKGTFNLHTVGHVIKIALMKNTYDVNFTTHTKWADVSADEVTGTGYTAGGATLGTLVAISTHIAEFKTTADVTWSDSYITAYGAIIYDNTAATKPLICWIDFGSTQESYNGDFTITWSDENNVIIEME